MVDRQAIINAFAKTSRPGDLSLCAGTCDECEWEVARFKDKKWSQLTLDDFDADDGNANLSLLTPAAFHYFLPGLILLIADNVQMEWLVLRIVERLVVSDRDDESRRECARQLIKSLSARQRQLMIDVLADWRQWVPCAPAIWEALLSSLHDGDVRCFGIREVEEYNASLVKNHRRVTSSHRTNG